MNRTVVLLIGILVISLSALLAYQYSPNTIVPQNDSANPSNESIDPAMIPVETTYKSMEDEMEYSDFYLLLTIKEDEFVYSVGDCNGTSHEIHVDKVTQETNVISLPTTRKGCPESTGYASETKADIKNYFAGEDVQAPEVKFTEDTAAVTFKNSTTNIFIRLIKQ